MVGGSTGAACHSNSFPLEEVVTLLGAMCPVLPRPSKWTCPEGWIVTCVRLACGTDIRSHASGGNWRALRKTKKNRTVNDKN